MKQISRLAEKILTPIEYILAVAILSGVFIHFVAVFPTWLTLDWSNTESYVHFLESVFALAIGIELARLFVSYSLEGVVELVVFLIARKLLFIDGTLQVLYGAIAIALLFAVLAGVGHINKKS